MRRHPAGLTLLELMVGLVILGLLMVALENGVQLGLRAWRTDARLSGASEDLITTDRVLRRLLTQMDPGGGSTALNLAGDEQELDFATSLPKSALLATRRVEARLLVDGKQRLVLRWTPHLHERSLVARPREQETMILDGVQQVAFSYWHGPPRAAWQKSWTDPSLPRLVRLHLVFPSSSNRHWPDFIVAPLLEPAGG